MSSINASDIDKEPGVHHDLNCNAKRQTPAELDEAAIVLQLNAGHVEFSVEEDRRILRLVDLWVLSKSLRRRGCNSLTIDDSSHVHRLFSATDG